LFPCSQTLALPKPNTHTTTKKKKKEEEEKKRKERKKEKKALVVGPKQPTLAAHYSHRPNHPIDNHHTNLIHHPVQTKKRKTQKIPIRKSRTNHHRLSPKPQPEIPTNSC